MNSVTVETVEIEDFIAAVGERHGLRMRDYSLVWDQGQFDPQRAVHTIEITTRIGTRAMAEISQAALSARDSWKYVRRINDAFEVLRSRSPGRET